MRRAGTASEGGTVTAGASAPSRRPQEFHRAACVKHPLGAVELIGEPYPAPVPFEFLAQTRESDNEVRTLGDARAPEKTLLHMNVAAWPLGKNLDVSSHHQRGHQSEGKMLAGRLEGAWKKRRPRPQKVSLDRQNDLSEHLPRLQLVESDHAAGSPSRRNDSSASSTTQPRFRGRTRSGLISTPCRRSEFAAPKRDSSATAFANAPTSEGGRPRAPSRSRRPCNSSIMRRASSTPIAP